MKLFINISVFVLSLSILVGCINNKKSSTAKDQIESADLNVANISGLYSGNLPCVDCESINTLLQLNRDNSYTLKYVYEGKSDDQFVKEGTWQIVKSKIVLAGVDYKYKIADDHLVQLDLSENEIKGDLADNYQLVKIK